MKKLNILITVFNCSLVLIMMLGFSGAGDKSISVGNNSRIVERDTNLAVIYGDDTVRLVLTRSGNNLILGSSSTNPSGSISAESFEGTSGASTFDKCWVNASAGVSEDFYVEGTSKLTGYLSGDSIYARTISTPELSGTNIVNSRYKMQSVSGADIKEGQSAVYLKNTNLIIAFKDGGGNLRYFYADLTNDGDITNWTYSTTEP